MFRHIFEDLPGRPEAHLPELIKPGQLVNLGGKRYRVESTELMLDTRSEDARMYVRTKPL